LIEPEYVSAANTISTPMLTTAPANRTSVAVLNRGTPDFSPNNLNAFTLNTTQINPTNEKTAVAGDKKVVMEFVTWVGSVVDGLKLGIMLS
jgi:hypothetical protein